MFLLDNIYSDATDEKILNNKIKKDVDLSYIF